MRSVCVSYGINRCKWCLGIYSNIIYSHLFQWLPTTTTNHNHNHFISTQNKQKLKATKYILSYTYSYNTCDKSWGEKSAMMSLGAKSSQPPIKQPTRQSVSQPVCQLVSQSSSNSNNTADIVFCVLSTSNFVLWNWNCIL